MFFVGANESSTDIYISYVDQLKVRSHIHMNMPFDGACTLLANSSLDKYLAKEEHQLACRKTYNQIGVDIWKYPNLSVCSKTITSVKM